jgi:uncharacterized Fe-S cluster-containing MiaB family protein
LKIDAGIKEYWSLKAVDSFQDSREINPEIQKQLVDDIVSNDDIKKILLGGG